MSYCRNCGVKINDDVKFCKECGAKTLVTSKTEANSSPSKNRKFTIIGILLVIVLVAVALLFLNNTPGVKNSSTTIVSTTQTSINVETTTTTTTEVMITTTTHTTTTILVTTTIERFEAEGWSKLQPISEFYRTNGNFEISINNVVGTSIKLTGISLLDISSKETPCSNVNVRFVSDLSNSVSHGANFNVTAICPARYNDDSFDLQAKINYTAVIGGISTLHQEVGNIHGIVGVVLISKQSMQEVSRGIQIVTIRGTDGRDGDVESYEMMVKSKTNELLNLFKGAVTDYMVAYTVKTSGGSEAAVSSGMTYYFKGETKMRVDSSFVMDGKTTESRFYMLDKDVISCNKMSGDWSCMKISTSNQKDPVQSKKDMEDNIKTSSITRIADKVVAGINTKCYKLVMSITNADAAVAQKIKDSGMEDWAGTYCVSDDGILLYSESTSKDIVVVMEAKSYKRGTADTDYVLPAEPKDLSSLMSGSNS